MAYEELPTDFEVDDPVRADWMNQIGENDIDHESRISDVEESAADHEDRLDLLEGTGPSSERMFVSTTTLTDAEIKVVSNSITQTLIASPGANYRIKVHNATYYSWFQNGTYTNIHADAWMALQTTGGEWLAGILANSAADSLTKLTTFFQSATPLCFDGPPYIEDDGGGWVTGAVTAQTNNVDNNAVVLALSNQGSGPFTGGHTSNTLTVVIYYSLEAVPAYYAPFTMANATQQQPRRRRETRRPANRNQGMQI